MAATPEILAALLRAAPHGLTAQEVAVLTGGANYTVNSRLSKLAFYGTVTRVAIHGHSKRYRYFAKAAVAIAAIVGGEP